MKKWMKIALVCVAIAAALTIAFLAAPRAPEPVVDITTTTEYTTSTELTLELGLPELAPTATQAGETSPEVPTTTLHTLHTTLPTTTTIRTGVFLSITGLNGAEILPNTNVPLQLGESVFALLQRETRARRIHMEHVGSAALGTVYIRGIANLYEFDHGELSGWKYQVNGEWADVGVCRRQLQPGDVVALIYVTDFVF
jgi:hypothetical protein